MIRHLYADRGDHITVCGLDSVVPASCTHNLESTTCRDCRAALVRKGICPACGGRELTWSTYPHELTTVEDGMPRVRDVETIFYLACEGCSETLISQVDPDVVAAALTEARWRP